MAVTKGNKNEKAKKNTLDNANRKSKKNLDEWVNIQASPDKKVKIDKEDLQKVSEHKWRVTMGTSGRPRVVTTIQTPDGARHLTLGRFLMDPPKEKQVYPRRFNDGLDYRKSNLVVCTLKERQRLLPKSRVESTSLYRGVSYSKRFGKWKAAIKINGKTTTIGFYKTEKEAALAYNKVALQKFGLIAYQNRIDQNKKKRMNS